MDTLAPRPGPLERLLARPGVPRPSVRLDRKRIYIMPTRVGAAFLLSLLLMLVAAINYQNSLAYALTFLLASLFVVAILHTWRNLAGLELQAGPAPAVFVGEPARFTVRLQAGARPRLAVALSLGEGEVQRLSVAEQGQEEAVLTVPARQRGWLSPGRLRVESRFPLGILVAWSWVELAHRALVYPQPLDGQAFASQGTGEGTAASTAARTGEGADDYEGPRRWQPGDSIRRLDWKAYSRGRGLLVKQFRAAASDQQTLDFSALEGAVEWRLSRLCDQVLRLSDDGRPFALRLPGRVIAVSSGAAHRDACLEALALFGLVREAAV